MIRILVLVLALCPGFVSCDLQQPQIETGVASQYATGVMSRVARYRMRSGQIDSMDGFDGLIAVQECRDIGRVFLIRPVSGVYRWERHLAVDCASKQDAREHDGLSGYAWMTRYNVLVEISFVTAQRWQTVGRAIEIELQKE